jgi:uncharacterized protein (TIGR02145 family)
VAFPYLTKIICKQDQCHVGTCSAEIFLHVENRAFMLKQRNSPLILPLLAIIGFGSCNTDAYLCVDGFCEQGVEVSPGGITFESEKDCQERCGSTATSWRCYNGQCYLSSTATYGSLQECLADCGPGVIYYNCVAGACVQVSEIGPDSYTLLSACEAGCGSVVNQVVDADGNDYLTRAIGNKTWMLSNLKTRKYANGDLIPNLSNAGEWYNATSGGYVDYDNDPSNVNDYGRLYNWFVVTDPRNVCPSGWHVATLADWNDLIATLGGEAVAGGKLKTTDLWNLPNVGATNEREFNGVPSGFRFDLGYFSGLGTTAFFWTASQTDDFNAAIEDSQTAVQL